MTGRPRPKARGKAVVDSISGVSGTEPVGVSQISDPDPAQHAAKSKEDRPIDDEEDDDFFAHRRRLMRRVTSRDVITPPPPPVAQHGSDSDDGGSAKKRKRRGGDDHSWVKSGVVILSEVEDEETVSENDSVEELQPRIKIGDATGDHSRHSEGFQRSPSSPRHDSSASALETTSPIVAEEKSIDPEDHRADSEDEEDDAGATLDSNILAEIQARYMTAQALSESDKPFIQSDEAVNVPCHIVVQCRLNPEQEKDMSVEEQKEWRKKRVFDAPRKEPLTGIYDTIGLKIGITNPTSNIVMTLENGTRIWSCYATPESLKLVGANITLLAYERRHYERMEAQKREAEAARFRGRLARTDRSLSTDLPASTSVDSAVASKVPPAIAIPSAAALPGESQEPIELNSDSDDGDYRPTARGDKYSSDIEILDDLPRQAVFAPAPTARSTASETPVTSAGLEIQVRGQSGQLSGSVSSTTTYDAIIKWYANEMKIPIETAAKGRGKDRVPKKRLKIDFDGDLFDGSEKILDLDLEGGETLDIKYV